MTSQIRTLFVIVGFALKKPMYEVRVVSASLDKQNFSCFIIQCIMIPRKCHSIEVQFEPLQWAHAV